jgi:hypothetical protein
LQFFKNLEEVKKVIHAWRDGAIRHGVLKNMGFDCINRTCSSRTSLAQTRDKTPEMLTSQEGLTL